LLNGRGCFSACFGVGRRGLRRLVHARGRDRRLDWRCRPL